MLGDLVHFSKGAGFNSFFLPKVGVFSDHAGLAVYPLYTKTITVNIGFDNPFLGTTGLAKTCLGKGKVTSTQLLDAQDIINTLMADIKDLLDPSSNRYTSMFCAGIEHLCDRDFDMIPDHQDPDIHSSGNSLRNMSSHDNPKSNKNLEGDYSEVSKFMKSSHIRRKRLAPALIIAAIGSGLFTLGNAIYSWISIKQLSDRIGQLEDQNTQIEEAIQGMVGMLHAFKEADNDMYHALRNIIPELAQSGKRTDCEVFRTRIDLFVSYAYRTREAIIRVVNAALLGSVTTEMITAHELKTTLLESLDFKDSIYREDLDLFYKLSMAIPLAYNTNTHTLSVAIAIPMLTNGDVSPIYSIKNIGWVSNTRMYKVLLPETVVIISEEREKTDVRGNSDILKQAIPLFLSECDNRGRIYLCTHKNLELTHETSCANVIFSGVKENIKDDCTISSMIVTRENIKAILPTDNYIVFRGYESYMLQNIMKNRISQPKTIYVEKNNITIVKYGTFDFIQIGSSSISGKRERLSVTVRSKSYVNTSVIDDTDLDHLLDGSSWTKLDNDMEVIKQKEKEMERFANFNDRRLNYDKTISIMIFLMVVALIGSVIYLIKRYRRQRQIQLDMQDLLTRSISRQKRAILQLANQN